MRMITGFLCAAGLCIGAAWGAAPLARDKVPEPLKPWTDWVLRGKEDQLCPFLDGQADARHCAWPSRLQLTLDARGGRFAQEWLLERELWVPLPGEEKRWPQEVRVDGTSALLAPQGGAPSVFLKPGPHRVEGTFAWDALPDSLQIPNETGLLALSVSGRSVAYPNRDETGRVWLQKQASEEKAENRTDLTVHRRVLDEIPLQVTTHIELQVSGKTREEVLGKALLDGFVPMSLDSSVPARLESDGRLRVQLRPGHYAIDVTARHGGPVAALALGEPGGPWASEEVWAFDARNSLRLVTVEGVTGVDPQQTTLPDAWKSLPAYRMKPGDTMRFDQKRRGDSDPAPDQLKLQRDLWLDFNGSGYTLRDEISGTLSRSWRLEMAEPVQLGRVAVGGRDQFITRLNPTARAGVEIRQGTVQAEADSRIDGERSEVPAVGWDQDFHEVSGTLHLPPGWRLFSATGVDDVPDTWIRTWTLLDLFLALIAAMAIGRLWGVKWGALAVAAMALTFTEADAPNFTWLAALAAEALVRVLPQGRIRQVLRLARLGTWAVLMIFAIPFCIQQVRHGMYPALEQPYRQSASFASISRGLVAASRKAPSPAPPEAMEEATTEADGEEGGVVGGVVSGKVVARPPAQSADSWDKRSGGYGDQLKNQKTAYFQEVDPNSMVQTGPGVPTWDWKQFPLRWNGPVQRAQQVGFWLLPPRVNLVLGYVRVTLVACLLLCLIGFGGWGMRLLRGGSAAGVAAVLMLALPGLGRAAEFPPDATLEELQRRLLDKPDCFPRCASSPRLLLEVTAAGAQLRMEVSAAAATAVPLPGGAQHWVPSQVLLDGAPAKGLTRMPDGFLWIALEAGTHQIQLEGAFPDRETVQIPLPLKPHRVEARLTGWTLEGLHEDGLADDDLQLTRVREKKTGAPSAALQQGTLPPFVRVERALLLGLRWEATTRVTRLTPRGSAVVLEVPLMPGESVTSADVRVEGNKALVNMSPQATEVGWTSVLEPSRTLKLVAPESASWTEVWQLNASPVLHVEPAGIPPVHQQDATGNRVPEWRPWPGESVEIQVNRPEGIPGQTLTVDRVFLTLQPGIRATDAVLNINLRASRGGQHTLTLPEGAELQSVTINGATQPIRQENREVRLPVVPGAQQAQLTWREPRGTGLEFTTSPVDVGAPSTNIDLQVSMPQTRWVLLLGGPRLGPAVLFWSLLLVLLLVAIGLSRVGLSPLRWYHWVLLGLGLSQVPMIAAAVVAGWLLALGWRNSKGPGLGNKAFDLFQILLVGWTVAALVILFIAIHQGLLGVPDMQIEGNGSGYGTLHWYQDRSANVLPTAWAISVPLLGYRLAMLAWALWLALAMLRWLRWAWGSFTEKGAWRTFFTPPKPRPPPAPAPVPKGSP
jgi:hypothetical protein